MGHVAVVGNGPRAAQWATRLLAAGLDVVVDDSTIRNSIEALWPAADRAGLFHDAALTRLRVATSDADIASADLVQVVSGAAPDGCSGLVATEDTARATEPIHLVPLVEISGPQQRELAAFYRAIGMTPLGPDAADEERWELGEGLVRLAAGNPDSIIAIMRGLRASGRGAGAAMSHHEACRLASGGVTPWRPGDAVAAPLALYRTRVEPDWVDYNGHMSESAYLTAAGWASDALFRYIGDDEAYREAGHSFYTVETHIHYLLEVDLHEPIAFTTQVLGADAKRIHLLHCMHHGDTDALLCTIEQMLLHVDMNAGRAAAMLPEVAAAVEAIAAAHATLPAPPQVGTIMRLKR